MHRMVARKWYWPTLRADCEKFVAECELCSKHKYPRMGEVHAPRPFPLEAQKFDHVSMDFACGLPVVQQDQRRFDKVLVVSDRATRATVLIPTSKNATAEETCQLLEDHVWSLYGVPSSVTCDRDPLFRAKYFYLWCKEFGIRV